MEYLPTSIGCLAHQLLGSGDASYYEKDVIIHTGHVIPHGYYKVIHRDTFIADAAFYYRLLGFAVFFTFMRLAVGRYLVQVRIASLRLLFLHPPSIQHFDVP